MKSFTLTNAKALTLLSAIRPAAYPQGRASQVAISELKSDLRGLDPNAELNEEDGDFLMAIIELSAK
jgi:hypothetical protein